jgi:transcriptional regulator with XRE-family HTH domain
MAVLSAPLAHRVDYTAGNGCGAHRPPTVRSISGTDQVERVGTLLRRWRQRRGLSQLQLGVQADVSTRHLSFVETGRTRPSRAMVLHLAEHLEVPLAGRNRLLLAAGYAPVYGQRGLDEPDMNAVRAAVRQVLDGHLPYPALVVDRRWDLVDSNAAAEVFLDGVDEDLLRPPVNMMRLALHPRGFAPRLLDADRVRSFLLTRLARQVARTGNGWLAALHDELVSYGPAGELPRPAAHEVALPIRLHHRGRELNLISTIATFGTAQDITLEQIAIESYFPTDAATAAALHGRPR